jgi:hypothetical protein
VASRTVWSFVDALHRVLYAMFPARKAELAFLRRIVGRLHARVIPARPIEPDLIHPDRFERVAYAGTDAAERAAAHGAPTKARQMAAESADPILCASRFRDYLLLALQGACGLRLRNLAMMRIGTHLVQHDTDSDRFWVLFRPTETKNRKEIHKPLPRKLTPYLRRYLEHHRLVLLRQGDGSAEEQALWITQYGRPLSADGINRRLAILTRRHFGRTLRSHRFRHCLASFMPIEAPSKAAAVPALLGNGLAAAERYYIRGQQVASRLSHLKTIAELRSAARQAHAGSREPADGPPTRRRRRPRCAR